MAQFAKEHPRHPAGAGGVPGRPRRRLRRRRPPAHPRARRSTPTGTTTGSASSGTAACGSTSCSAPRRSPAGSTGAFDRPRRAGRQGRQRPRPGDRRPRRRRLSRRERRDARGRALHAPAALHEPGRPHLRRRQRDRRRAGHRPRHGRRHRGGGRPPPPRPLPRAARRAGPGGVRGRGARGRGRPHGRIDVFYDNAGIAVAGGIEELTPEHWDSAIDVNLRGVIHGVEAVYPVMRAQGHGHIVITASLAGLIPVPLLGPYTVTKHAVVALARVLRLEAAASGVRVSALCPAFVQTPMLGNINPGTAPTGANRMGAALGRRAQGRTHPARAGRRHRARRTAPQPRDHRRAAGARPARRARRAPGAGGRAPGQRPRDRPLPATGLGSSLTRGATRARPGRLRSHPSNLI